MRNATILFLALFLASATASFAAIIDDNGGIAYYDTPIALPNDACFAFGDVIDCSIEALNYLFDGVGGDEDPYTTPTNQGFLQGVITVATGSGNGVGGGADNNGDLAASGIEDAFNPDGSGAFTGYSTDQNWVCPPIALTHPSPGKTSITSPTHARMTKSSKATHRILGMSKSRRLSLY